MKKTVWRGAYGDVQPVCVPRANAMDARGRLRAAHFETEIEAWGSLLDCWDDKVREEAHAVERARQDYMAEQRELVATQARQMRAGENFAAWRQTRTAEQAAAV